MFIEQLGYTGSVNYINNKTLNGRRKKKHFYFSNLHPPIQHHPQCPSISHYEFHTMHFTPCISHYAFNTMHFTLYTSQYAFHTMHFKQCISHCTFQTMHFTLCISQHAFHSIHFIHTILSNNTFWRK